MTVRRTQATTLLFAALLGCDPPPSAGPTARASASASGSAAASASASGSAAANAPPPPAGAVREGSAIARTNDDTALLVADEDHRVVRVLPFPLDLGGKPIEVQVPGPPAQLLSVGDRVLVSIRDTGQGEGALLVLRRKGLDLEEAGRVPLPGDAWGIGLSADGATALVTSAWTHKLSAVDLATLKVRWSVDVAREPRAVVILAKDDRAYVTHLTSGNVTRIDALGAASPTVTSVEVPAGPLYSPYKTKLPATLGWSAVASPTGDRLYLPRHAIGALGPDAWFGLGVVDVLVTASEQPLTPARNLAPAANVLGWVGEMQKSTRWISGHSSFLAPQASLAEPRAVVYRKKTDTLLVASEGTNQIYELDALALDPILTGRLYPACLAPGGIVLSADENTAYVFGRGNYDVVAVRLPPGEGSFRSAPPTAIKLVQDDGPKDVAEGRRLFLDARNSTVSGGVACAGCHPEGRDDGQAWHEVTFADKDHPDDKWTNFFGGSDLSAINEQWGEQKVEGEGGLGYARQTPMLAGRVGAKGPYGWHGESPDLTARLVAGFGLHRWSGRAEKPTAYEAAQAAALAAKLAAYLRQGLVPPPRPPHELTDEERRGQTIFMSAETQCAKCHVPESEYTDRAPSPLRLLSPLKGYAKEENGNFRTPSLLFVGGTPPYLHDGRFDSLDSLLEYNQDRMGKTAQLKPEDKKALVAFLKTL